MKIWSLQPKLVVLILLALMPMGLLLVKEADNERRRSVEAAKVEAIQLCGLLAGTQQAILETLRQLLMTLEQVDSVRNRSEPGCEELLKSLVQTNSIYWNLGVCDAAGKVVCSGGPLGFSADQGGEAWFTRTLQSRDLAVGDFRVNSAGRPTMIVGYPIMEPESPPTGAVFAEVDLGAASSYNAHVPLLFEGYMIAVDQDGLILLRYPNPDEWIGKFYKDADLVKLLKNRESGTFSALDQDGRERIYAVQSLDTPGERHVYIAVAILKDSAVASPGLVMLRRLALVTGIGALLLLAVWIIGNRYVVRPTRHLVGVARAVSGGNLKVRSSLPPSTGEFREIGIAIDQMAETLGNRIIELDQVRHELQDAHDELEARVERRTEELRRSNEELERFAYVASHDLQEPLRMVASYTQLLARRYREQLDQNARDFIDYAVDGAQRMQAFIRDLLQYSRVGTQLRPFQPVEMGPLVNETLGNLRFAIEETGAVVEVGELPTVSGDRVLLGQLMQNLIGNALKFHSEKPPRIAIGAVHEESGWRFSIKDNGIGLAPEDTERIFVIFQRLHTRKEYEGTGIGLSICKKIVERHGGRIWVESRKGEGATFYFTIAETADERSKT